MAKTPGKKQSFEDWIDEVGPDELAKQLKVNPKTVSNWLFGYTDPRVDQMRRIKKMTKGRIGYDQMIDRPCRSVEALKSRFEQKISARAV